MASAVPENRNRDLLSVLAVWLLLSVILIFLALPNTAVPGLNYDEVHCAAMARDFLTGHPHPHMVESGFINLFGRRFPTFVQIYGGAVKSWLLLPSFAVFGATGPVLRMTALGWSLVALLVFMLWTWRWLGRNTALIAGTLLALDPSYFFISVLDWGPSLPSFLCRFMCFYWTLRWWRLDGKAPRRRLCHAFFAGLFAGLGFFNKIDFAVLLFGVLFALLCWNARRLETRLILRRFPSLSPSFALMFAGFLIAAAPMLAHVPKILLGLPAGGRHEGTLAEFVEKLHVMRAMYDGSYFYRMMDAGGLFGEMYKTPAPIFAPLGPAFILAAVYLIYRRGEGRDVTPFLLLSTLFITLGLLWLGGAVKIHHMVLVYPFPHLVVALAVARLLHRKWVVALFVLLLASQLVAIHRTQQLIEQTGGRGYWSDAVNAFARSVKNRSDLSIISLDWGFNEQLDFLTDGPQLSESFWNAPHAPYATNCIYLVHPPEFSHYPIGPPFLEEARRVRPDAFKVQPWPDHQGHTVFYSIHFGGP